MTRLLVACAVLCAFPRILAGQADSSAAPADTLDVGIRLHPAAPPLTLKAPAALRVPGAGDAWLPDALHARRWDTLVSRTLDSARAEAAVARRMALVYGPPVSTEDSLDAAAIAADDDGLLGVSRQYADLVIDGQARLEIRTDRLRNERCTPALLLDPNSGCRGGFKAPRIENQFAVRSGGIIGQRVHVNVDYDSQRDFGGNNDIQLFYQGLEDEIIRRIEVGTVQFVAPPSRFLGAAIPTNNFGVNAAFELGPVRLQALAATQKGSVVAERTYTIGQEASQQQERTIRDVDIETGRFFWVIDPALMPGFPAVDILSIDPATVPEAERPVEIRVYRKRSTQVGSGNPNLGGIPAVALRPDSEQRAEGEWELLVQGTDYYVDPSGTWIGLAATLGRSDFLAVSYVTASGDRVGTFPATPNPNGVLDTLRLIVDPQRGPEVPTFRYEMRQVYRVAGNDLDPSTLVVSLVLGQSDRPEQGLPTYLAQLGLAIPTDAAVLDRENRLFPRTRDPGADQVLRESYIVFPHLTPFADPTRLTPTERSDSLYRTPTYLLLTQGPPARFQIRMRYNSLGGGDRTSLNLNALQIREGTERLAIGGRVLQRDVDYTIAYETGQVTFLNPDALFGTGTAQVTARFEEQGVFAVAPTSIMGFSTQYSLGENGVFNVVGMYQREQTVFSRPQLGFEAKANLVGGANTRFSFQPMAVTRFLDGLTSSPATAPSRLDVNAEVAFTRPDPNRSGAAYLEEFEADAGFQVSLREGSWGWGSRPQRADGLEAIGFAAGFDSASAVQLSWQNLVKSGNTALQFRPIEIDPNIRIAGRGELYETVLYLTLHADTAGGYLPFGRNQSRWTQPARPGQPRWRSIVTPLSNTGVDVSRHEYLEFWVLQSGSSADEADAQLVLDIGTVSEDALVVAPESLTVNGADSLFSGRRYAGVGRLDTERTLTGTWDASRDDIGIHGDRPDVIFTPDGPLDDPALCQQELTSSVLVFPWGDLSSRCTNGNGQLDTEDLNSDFVLDAGGPNEDVNRYIVPLTDDQSGEHFVREGGRVTNADGSTSVWRLYRVPLRTPDAVLGTPNDRLVRQLRVTVAAPPDPGTDRIARFALARMRFVGSSWVRRSLTPVEGLAGSVGSGHGEVIASIISTENEELGYESPPGVRDATTRQDGSIDDLGTQVNEKSLRVIARNLQGGERAEAYLRFPAGAQNLLNYREMRVWARGRGPGWDDQRLQVFVKLGSDDQNFYLYRAPARTTTWEPELVIDLERWRALRGDVESRWLRGEPANGEECGVAANVYAACDGPYLVHLGSPGVSPPNLAAVQEISAGIWRPAGVEVLEETEVWVDDIRLTAPVGETGVAMAADVRLAASDVGDISFGFVRQDGQFRQIGRLPTYRTTSAFSMGSNLQLDRFLPTALGLAMPATVTFVRSDVDPQLVTGTDLRGAALQGLRRPTSWNLNTSLTLRRRVRGGSWLTRGLLDPMVINFNHTRGATTTERSEANAVATAASANYNLQLDRRGPRFSLGGLVNGLPDWLRNSEAGKALNAVQVSLVPNSVRLSSGLVHNGSDYRGFQVPVERPGDDAILPTRALTHTWRNAAGVTWQPLGMLTLGADLASTRDLRHYSDSTELGRLAGEKRQGLLGMDVGVERDRNLTTSFMLNPRIASWFRPRFSTSSSFVLARSLTSREPVRELGDTAGAFFLPQTLNNSRAREVGASVDVGRGLRALFGDSSAVGQLTRRFRAVDVSRRITRSSTFDLAAFDPGLSYQLGFGGLDDFQEQHGHKAVGAAVVRTSTFATGAELPFGLSGTVSYSQSETDRYQRALEGFRETQTTQVEWPVGSLRMSRTFRAGPVATFAAGTTFRRREGTSRQPSASGVTLSTNESFNFSPDLMLGFRNGLTASLGYNANDQETLTNGRHTISEQDDWTGSLSYSFRIPSALSRTRKLMRSTLTVLFSESSSCLERADEVECLTISNVMRREFRGGLSTDLNRSMTGELQGGYSINDARHLDRRTSQIFLSVGVHISLFAGDYR